MSQQSDRSITDLRPQRHQGARQVFIDPRVNPAALRDPATAAYAAGLAARAAGRGKGRAELPKYQQEVGGGPSPNIPLLNQEITSDMPMAFQAGVVNQPSHQQVLQQAAQGLAPGSIIESPAILPQMNQEQRFQQAILKAIQPGDMLPPNAQKDPTFQGGSGALFAASQPHLVMKYGLVRNGRHMPPQQLGQMAKATPGHLSPASVEGLQALVAHGKKPPSGLPSNDEEAEAQAAASASASSAKVGQAPPKGKPGEKKLTDEEKGKIRDAIEKMDSFDYDALQRQIEEDMLNNPDQRGIIEGRLAPLDIDSLIRTNRVLQDVVIHPGKLWITFESMTAQEDLVLKQLIMKESKSIEVTGQYLLDKFAFMSISIGLKAINGNPLPRHTDDNGEFSEDRFWIKFNWVLQKPLHLIACIGCNHSWFESRVRKLFVAEKLGNG